MFTWQTLFQTKLIKNVRRHRQPVQYCEDCLQEGREEDGIKLPGLNKVLTIKDKIGYPIKKTPVISKTGELLQCPARTFVNIIISDRTLTTIKLVFM